MTPSFCVAVGSGASLDTRNQLVSSFWGLRYDGSEGSLPIDKSLFRVTFLTHSNLQGYLPLLLEYTYVLFAGEASDWYYEYRKLDGRTCGALSEINFGISC